MKHAVYCWLVCALLVACHGERRHEPGRDAGAKHRARDASTADAAPPPQDASLDAAASDAAVSDAAVSDAAVTNFDDTPIARENRLPGSNELGQTHLGGGIEGYASATSAAPGETIELRVNVDVEQDVYWELFRIGDYQGHGARKVAKSEPKRVVVQPGCPLDPQTGLIECQWASAFSVRIAEDWTTGYYVFRLTNADGLQSYVPLIVREAGARAPILVQASVNTWQAYNRWGGTSLYRNVTKGGVFKLSKATRVSFDRPYDPNAPLFFKELPLISWLERRGYDVSYVTNVDVEADPALLHGRRVFTTVLHDEYWTVGERDALDQARDAGVSLLFLSANTGYWRVRLEASTTGVPRRIVTCYKNARTDPAPDQRDTTDMFRRAPFTRPENELIGVMWGDWSDFAGFPFVVSNPRHWIYEGTGVALHDTLTPIIGIEWDGRVDNGLTPPGLEIVGDSPAVSQDGRPFAHVNASVYYPTARSLVFAAGSINWITGLDDDHRDPRVHRMLENVFAHAGFRLAQPLRVEAQLPADVGQPEEFRTLAGTGSSGYRDGDAATSQLSSPAGVAAGLNDVLYIADTGNGLVRKLDRHGVLSTVAGCAPTSTADPNQLCLDNPVGIAADRQGNVYVSDTGHNRIVRVDSSGNVAVYAGTGDAGGADSTDRATAMFSNPRGVAIGPDGAVYVADFANNAIRRIDASGVSTVARGILDVAGVAVSPSGAVYVTSSRIPVARVQGTALELISSPDAHPLEGIVVDESGVVFADATRFKVSRVRESDATTVTLLGDGRAGLEAGRVVLPRGIAAFKDGYVVADSGNHRIVWFRAQPTP